jgi:hypothetical protein
MARADRSEGKVRRIPEVVGMALDGVRGFRRTLNAAFSGETRQGIRKSLSGLKPSALVQASA